MNAVLKLIYITLLPFLELRASIPYGILKTDMHWLTVFLICSAANIILAPIVWFFIHYIMHLFLKVKWIEKLYNTTVERSVKKVKPYVDRYGKIGLALFIGVPLPGSGVYSGALAASILEFKFKDYFIACVIGVLIAASLVTVIVLTGSEMFGFMLKGY